MTRYGPAAIWEWGQGWWGWLSWWWQSRKPLPPMPCIDCGDELMPSTPAGIRDWQRYMVHDHVWAALGLDPNDGWICIPCLESRLGRPLTGGDLAPVHLNDVDGKDTDRAVELKRATSELPQDRHRGQAASNCSFPPGHPGAARSSANRQLDRKSSCRSTRRRDRGR